MLSLVPRSLIQRVYRLQYNARKNGLVDLVHIPYSDTESDPRWGWFGSGTETKLCYADQQGVTVQVPGHRSNALTVLLRNCGGDELTAV